MDATVKRIIGLREKHVKKAEQQRAARLKDAKTLTAAVVGKHGKGAMRLMSSEDEIDVPCLSTGRQDFDDWLTGVDDVKLGGPRIGSGKGLPRGRIIEVYGPESSGKTTLTLDWIAAVQRSGGLCAFVDAEHAFDPKWARRQGVVTEELLLSQPDSGEEALQIVQDLAASKKVSMIVVDSVAALVPEAELKADMKKQSMGAQAAMMSRSLRKLKGIANKTGCIIIFINQLRMKIGVMFGNPEETPGGKALKFYASVRIDVRRVATLKKKVTFTLKDGTKETKDKAYGVLTKAKIVKNKIAPPFRELKFLIEFSKGITETGDHL